MQSSRHGSVQWDIVLCKETWTRFIYKTRVCRAMQGGCQWCWTKSASLMAKKKKRTSSFFDAAIAPLSSQAAKCHIVLYCHPHAMLRKKRINYPSVERSIACWHHLLLGKKLHKNNMVNTTMPMQPLPCFLCTLGWSTYNSNRRSLRTKTLLTFDTLMGRFDCLSVHSLQQPQDLNLHRVWNQLPVSQKLEAAQCTGITKHITTLWRVHMLAPNQQLPNPAKWCATRERAIIGQRF